MTIIVPSIGQVCRNRVYMSHHRALTRGLQNFPLLREATVNSFEYIGKNYFEDF